MPWTLGTKTISRLWQFVDQFAVGATIDRIAHDATQNDLVASVNAAIAAIYAEIEAVGASSLYLGTFADAPTEGPAESALVEGNTYIKTPEFETYVYNGAAWVRAERLKSLSTDVLALLATADFAEFRATMGLGTAATFASSSFATAGALGQTANRLGNAIRVVSAAGSGNLFQITSFAPITAYADGQSWLVRMNREPTGAATANIDGQGFVPVMKYDATNALVEIEAGDWKVGDLVPFHYDGTRIVVPKYGRLGTVATRNTGTAEGNIPVLGPGGALPAISGENLTELPAGALWTEIDPIVTTSGTAFDVTSIPDGVNDVEIFLLGISLSSAQSVLIQIGTGASPTETGYDGAFTNFGGSIPHSTGFVVAGNTAEHLHSGVVKLRRVPGTNQWMEEAMINPSGTVAFHLSIGTITLSGALNNIRVTRTSTGTFDAGSFAARYR